MRDLLTKFNFKFIIVDQSIFFNNNIDIIITAYIDNLLITDKNINKINKLQKQLQTKIEISDLSNVNFFFDMKIN